MLSYENFASFLPKNLLRFLKIALFYFTYIKHSYRRNAHVYPLYYGYTFSCSVSYKRSFLDTEGKRPQ